MSAHSHTEATVVTRFGKKARRTGASSLGRCLCDPVSGSSERASHTISFHIQSFYLGSGFGFAAGGTSHMRTYMSVSILSFTSQRLADESAKGSFEYCLLIT